MLIFVAFGDDLAGFSLEHFLLGFWFHKIDDFVVKIAVASCLFFKPIESQLAAALLKVLANRVMACKATHRKCSPIRIGIVLLVQFECLCNMFKRKTFVPQFYIRLNLGLDISESLSLNWVLL